jgi:hypothetical protein
VSFENRVLKKIFGLKRDKVTGVWRNCMTRNFINRYASSSMIKIFTSMRMRRAWHVARMGEKMNACRILVGKPEGTRPLRGPRRRWVNNIKMDHREIR